MALVVALALLVSLALLASEVAKRKGSVAGAVFSSEAAAVWLAGSLGLSFASTRLLVAWRLSAGAITSWSAALAGSGYPVRGTVTAILAGAWYLATFHPGVRTLLARRISLPGERRIPLRIPVLLLVLVVTPASLLTGFTAGVPALVAAGLEPSPLWVVVAAGGLLAALPLAVSTDRMERRWLIIAPRGLVVHDPFMLSSTLRIPPEVADYAEPAGRDWRLHISDPATFLDLTAGALGTPLILRLRSRIEAPQPRHIGIGTAFPPGGCVTLVAVAPVFPETAFAYLARAGYARPGEFAKLEGSTPEDG